MNFFVRRPIFAIAMALILILAGVVSLFQLPVAQYPTIAPPQIAVTSSYIGAGAKVLGEDEVVLQRLGIVEGLVPDDIDAGKRDHRQNRGAPGKKEADGFAS